MAAETVVEAVLSASFQFLFGKMASPDVVSYFTGKKQSDFCGLLDKFKTMFYSLSAVLVDAEQKQIKNPAVKKWLDELQDVVYDAEDLFGEIEYDALLLKVEAESSRTSTTKVSNFISKFFNSTDRERKTKMEEVLERLENFSKQINVLGLDKGVGEKPSGRLPSTSLLESQVYGRDADKDTIMKLLSDDNLGSPEICVIPIVGMGGIGKTTFAQVVFNDNKVEEMFELKAWVCVSDEFDVCTVTKTIFEAITLDACNVTDLNSLQVELKKRLTGKTFFIVLDDCWNESFADWDVLRMPLKYGAQGSKILVTTRSKKVASVMGTVQPHYLKELTDEECLQLFAKHAYSGINRDLTITSDLERIGREIVKKCKGLPLAAKILGGILHSTLSIREWEKILTSEFWDLVNHEHSNILPVLRLSYYYLPSHFKRCFVYCSIFPKNYKFEKEKLVLLWMAANLLECPQRYRKMEEIGGEYFDDLESKSFFQKLTTNNNASYFIMHDYMVDLARFVAGEYYCPLLQSNNLDEVVRKTRHLACHLKNITSDKRFNNVFEASRLRTFLSLGCPLPKEAVHKLLKLKCLRVLSFYRSRISELPDSIAELRHLQYLDLSHNSIKMLPESFSMLYNLQTLKLRCCGLLKRLPKDMHHLINLRYLDIHECSQLVEMPEQISKLKNLQTLSTFIVEKNRGVKIGELRELSSLQGKLCIKKLENVIDVKDALDQANLADKNHLKQLRLEWDHNYGAGNSRHERDVLDMLLPNTTLKKLEIFEYPGTQFPNWLGDHSFGNLIFLELSGCKFCFLLPSLGQLPSLRTLYISGFKTLETVGPEFYGNSSLVKPFSSLEILKFKYMSSWEQWSSMQVEDDHGTFSKLRELEISCCPKLIGDLPWFFPSLTKLTINACEKFVSSLPRMPCVRELEFKDCENLFSRVKSLSEALNPTKARPQHSTISRCTPLISFGCLPTTLERLYLFGCTTLESSLNHRYELLQRLELYKSRGSLRSFPLDFFPNLKQLDIAGCTSLEFLSMSTAGLYQDLPSLAYLGIKTCPNFESFPKGGLPAPNLTFLQITGCAKLNLLPEKMHDLLTSLKTLDITNCPKIEFFPEGGLPFNLSDLIVRNCPKLIASRVRWNLHRLPGLKSFMITKSSLNEHEEESFPEEGLLPVHITSLDIRGFQQLKALDSNGLQQLTSLERQCIQSCKKLQIMPEEGLPSSLQYLCIKNCPLVERMCQPEIGEYWSKICHIPKVKINNKFIK